MRSCGFALIVSVLVLGSSTIAPAATQQQCLDGRMNCLNACDAKYPDAGQRYPSPGNRRCSRSCDKKLYSCMSSAIDRK